MVLITLIFQGGDRTRRKLRSPPNWGGAEQNMEVSYLAKKAASALPAGVATAGNCAHPTRDNAIVIKSCGSECSEKGPRLWAKANIP